MLLVIALGGAIGALGRYGLSQAVPHARDGFPWSTLLINVSGCLLIGILMVYVVEVGAVSRYVRPFLGIGVLGGYTTFSTYALDGHDLLTYRSGASAAAYVFGTLVGALIAVALGVALRRVLFRSRGAR